VEQVVGGWARSEVLGWVEVQGVSRCCLRVEEVAVQVHHRRMAPAQCCRKVAAGCSSLAGRSPACNTAPHPCSVLMLKAKPQAGASCPPAYCEEALKNAPVPAQGLL
jgi:hypothetical protein